MDTSTDSNFRKFFNDINDFLFVLDLKGNILEVNSAVVSILGYSKEELLGKPVLVVHPPDLRDKAAEIVAGMMAGKTSSCPIPLLAKNNSRIPVETRVYTGTWNGSPAIIGVSRNLSELALSERKFFEVFDNTQALMAISVLETGVFTDVNKQFLRVLGYTREEIVGKSSRDLNLFHDYAQRVELSSLLANGEKISGENVIIRTKSGELLHCLFSAAVVRVEPHSFLFTSATDITRQRLAEKRLTRNLRRQTLLADISQLLNSIRDVRRKLDDVLSLMGRHTGVSRVYIFEDDPSGTTCSNTYEWCNEGVTPQKDNLQSLPYDTIPSWKKILSERGRVFSTNIDELPPDLLKVLKPQGIRSILVLPFYVEERFFGFMGFDECAVNREWEQSEIDLLKTISNIISATFERIEFQRRLGESEARLALAMENTEAGLWDWNIATGAVYFNDGWCRMLGYEKSEIEPNVKAWEKLLHPDDVPAVMETLKRHLSGQTDVYMTTHRLLTKGGQWKWVMDKGRIIEWDIHGRPTRAVGTHIDIDNQKKTEAELRTANAAKDKLFSVIAHDLRGPIGTIMQISELLSEKGSVDEKTLYVMIDSQKTMLRNTFRLLENLLSWARYNSNQIVPHPRRLDIAAVIAECVDDIRLPAERKGIELSCGDGAPVSAFADDEMVRLVIRNLLSNALKFTPSGGRIAVSSAGGAEQVTISVANMGPGISEENIAKIMSDDTYFTTFGTDNEKGAGLGLKLCRSFVLANDGSFNVRSEASGETVFSVTLPSGG